MDPIEKASMLINDTTKTEELVDICKEASLSFAIITAIEGLYQHNLKSRSKAFPTQGKGGICHCNNKNCERTHTHKQDVNIPMCILLYKCLFFHYELHGPRHFQPKEKGGICHCNNKKCELID